MSYPRVSADAIRAKLQEQSAELDPLSQAGEIAPDPTEKPLVWCGSTAELVLQFWQDAALPGGDIAMLIRLPESFASALRAEGERHNYTLGQQFADLIQRMADAGYV